MTLTQQELRNAIEAAGYGANNWSLADRRYAMPTRGFISGAFSAALWSFQSFFNILNWVEEAMDCDDFARIAAGFAQILHFLTPNRPPQSALAVGELWYQRDSGEGHAINLCVCGLNPEDVVAYEPQTRQIVTLNEGEKLLASMIRF